MVSDNSPENRVEVTTSQNRELSVLPAEGPQNADGIK